MTKFGPLNSIENHPPLLQSSWSSHFNQCILKADHTNLSFIAENPLHLAGLPAIFFIVHNCLSVNLINIEGNGYIVFYCNRFFKQALCCYF